MKKLSSEQIFDFIAKNESIINRFEMDNKNQISFDRNGVDVFLFQFQTKIATILNQEQLVTVLRFKILENFYLKNNVMSDLEGNFCIEGKTVKLSVNALFNLLNKFQNWLEGLQKPKKPF